MTIKQYLRFVKIHTSVLSLFGYVLGAAIIFFNGSLKTVKDFFVGCS